MKFLDLKTATDSLADYARGLEGGSIVFTDKKKPVAVLFSLPSGTNMESFGLGTNSDFIALLEKSRASLREKGGVTIEEVRRRLGMPPVKKKRSKK
jgi:hypothetical protein